MKVLLFNGSPRANGCTYTALSEIAEILGAESIETEILHAGNKPVRDCIGCGGCVGKGVCGRFRKRMDRKSRNGGRLRFRNSRILRAPVGTYSFRYGQNVLCGRRQFCAKTRGGHSVRPSRRYDGGSRCDRKAFDNIANARCIFDLLEHGARKHARRDEAGRGRYADDEKSCKKYGVDLKVYRGGKAGGHKCAAGGKRRSH